MSTKNTPAPGVAATEDQMGCIIGFIKKRLEAMKLTTSQAERIITNGGLFNRYIDRALVNFIADEFEEYSFQIDPAVSFEDRLRRGNYNYVHQDITTEKFKLRLTEPVRRSIVLYDPKGPVSSEEMIRRIQHNGDRRPTFDDVLEFGYRFPDRQRKNPIAFLLDEGLWRISPGDARVPVLDEWLDGRELDLRLFTDGWHAIFRFAVVREL